MDRTMYRAHSNAMRTVALVVLPGLSLISASAGDTTLDLTLKPPPGAGHLGRSTGEVLHSSRGEATFQTAGLAPRNQHPASLPDDLDSQKTRSPSKSL